jgi:hypothetical protein
MTWKQFFVHMSIVVLGLLIAIALEQSVEGLHHRHERNELIAHNREECRKNFETTSNFLSYLDQERALADQWAALLETAPVHDGSIAVTVPSGFRDRETLALAGFARVHHVLPEMAVLATARESQILQYLPTETAQYFNWAEGVDTWAQFYTRDLVDTNAAYVATMSGTRNFGILPQNAALALTPATRDRAVSSLREWAAKTRNISFQYARLNIYFRATADGALTEAEYNRWMQDHPTAP